MAHKIIVTIDADAHVSVEVAGVAGKGCHALTDELVRSLGTVSDVHNTPDYYRQQTAAQQQQAGH